MLFDFIRVDDCELNILLKPEILLYVGGGISGHFGRVEVWKLKKCGRAK
jgi:hypothetical protein